MTVNDNLEPGQAISGTRFRASVDRRGIDRRGERRQTPDGDSPWSRQCRFLIFLVVLLGANGCFGPKKPVISFGDIQPPQPDSLERKMVDLINAYRARNNVSTVVYEPLLGQIARTWSNEMAISGFCNHVHPRDRKLTPLQRLILFNRERLAKSREPIRLATLEENVGFVADQRRSNDSEYIEILWKGFLDSRRHRKNIINPAIDRVGLGIVIGKVKGVRAMYCTQLFGLQSQNPVYFLGVDKL